MRLGLASLSFCGIGNNRCFCVALILPMECRKSKAYCPLSHLMISNQRCPSKASSMRRSFLIFSLICSVVRFSTSPPRFVRPALLRTWYNGSSASVVLPSSFSASASSTTHLQNAIPRCSLSWYYNLEKRTVAQGTSEHCNPCSTYLLCMICRRNQGLPHTRQFCLYASPPFSYWSTNSCVGWFQP